MHPKTTAPIDVEIEELTGHGYVSSVSENFLGDSPPYDEFFPLPQLIEEEVGNVLEMRLSRELSNWVDAYELVGHRNIYLWKWCRRGVEVTTLPCVDEDLREEEADTKVLGVMLDVLLDDVADRGGNSAYLTHLLNIPFGNGRGDEVSMTRAEREYAAFVGKVWDEIQSRVTRYPLYAEYAELLKFDYQQLFNTMRYSQMLNNNPALLNLAEHDLYLPHNMHMMISSTIDLMCSPGFDRDELGLCREAICRTQYMGRIGNLVTTWQREIGEGDFTSGVFAHAVSRGNLTHRDFLSGDMELLSSAILGGNSESYFLERWQTLRRELKSMCGRLRSFDLESLVQGLERLICLHLGSRGQK